MKTHGNKIKAMEKDTKEERGNITIYRKLQYK